MDYGFKFEVCLLHDKTFQTLPDVWLMVVGNAADAHHGGISIHIFLFIMHFKIKDLIGLILSYFHEYP